MTSTHPLLGRTLAAAVVTIACSMSAAVAVGQERAVDRLTKATSIKCTFPTMAIGGWNGGTPSAEVKPVNLTIGFEEINTDDGTARVIGAFGPSDIIVRLSLRTLHLVQMFSDGPIYATTIFPSESANGKLKAVHTRHAYAEIALIGFTSRPEQYYGECEIVK